MTEERWFDAELSGCRLGDGRLDRRLRQLVGQMEAGFGESIPLACQDWASTKAAYRFFSNERVDEEEILRGHFDATRHRLPAGASGASIAADPQPAFRRPEHVDGDLARTRRAMAVCIGAGIAEDTVFRERRWRHMEKPRSSLLSRPLPRLSVSRAFSEASWCLSAVGTGMTSMLRSWASLVRDVDLAEVVKSTTAMGPASMMSRWLWAIAKPRLFIQSGLNTTRSTSFARAHSSANFMAGAAVCPWMKNRSG